MFYFKGKIKCCLSKKNKGKITCHLSQPKDWMKKIIICNHSMTLPILLLTNLNCQAVVAFTNIPISMMKEFIYSFFYSDFILGQCYCLFKDWLGIFVLLILLILNFLWTEGKVVKLAQESIHVIVLGFSSAVIIEEEIRGEFKYKIVCITWSPLLLVHVWQCLRYYFPIYEGKVSID